MPTVISECDNDRVSHQPVSQSANVSAWIIYLIFVLGILYFPQFFSFFTVHGLSFVSEYADTWGLSINQFRLLNSIAKLKCNSNSMRPSENLVNVTHILFSRSIDPTSSIRPFIFVAITRCAARRIHLTHTAQCTHTNHVIKVLHAEALKAKRQMHIHISFFFADLHSYDFTFYVNLMFIVAHKRRQKQNVVWARARVLESMTYNAHVIILYFVSLSFISQPSLCRGWFLPSWTPWISCTLHTHKYTHSMFTRLATGPWIYIFVRFWLGLAASATHQQCLPCLPHRGRGSFQWIHCFRFSFFFFFVHFLFSFVWLHRQTVAPK